MSVIFFGVEELATVARVATASRWSTDRHVEELCEALAMVSQANAACYAYRYSHKGEAKPVGVSKAQILRAMPTRAQGVTRAQITEALSVSQLLHYNCHVMSAMLRHMATRFEGEV